MNRPAGKKTLFTTALTRSSVHDPRRGTAWRSLWLLAVSVLAIGLLAAAGPAGASSNGNAAQCTVRNQTTGTHYYGTGANLQSAISAANSGDTLDVWGTCVGNFNIPGTGGGTTLTLVGKATKHVREATLNGNLSGPVLYTYDEATAGIPDPFVTLTDLLITDGYGYGIQNGFYSVLTLNGTQVNHNDGVGIVNDPLGSLTLTGASKVDYNNGGGIANTFGATIILNGFAQVNHNNGEGIGNGDFAAKTTLNDFAQVDGNATTGDGGGISNVNGAEVTLNGFAQVDNNYAAGNGGGVDSEGLAGVLMNGSSQVDNNYAAGNGGGIYSDGSTVTLSQFASVDKNLTAGAGGGIYTFDGGPVTLNDSARVDRNTATVDGGGIYSNGGTVVGAASGVNVRHNKPDDCNSGVC